MSTVKEILELTTALAAQTRPSNSAVGWTGWDTKKSNPAATCDVAVADPERSGAKAILKDQANTLSSMFDHLAKEAGRTKQMQQAEVLLRLALKVQAQCVHTLRVLNEYDNPRQIAFVKQANIAQGHQQIINGGDMAPHAEKRGQSNELLEQRHGEWMDGGATGQAGSSHSALEALGAVLRSQD